MCRLYYQKSPSRLSTCTLPIHALLHISHSIQETGPVWCYWAFPTERYVGRLSSRLTSHRFPFAALDRIVIEDAQVTQIGAIYSMTEELSLKDVSQERGIIDKTCEFSFLFNLLNIPGDSPCCRSTLCIITTQLSRPSHSK